MMTSPSWIIFLITCLASVSSSDNATANLSTSWINSGYSPSLSGWSVDGTRVTPILMVGGSTFDPRYACGFYCKGLCGSHSYLFAIFIARENIGVPEVVWSANRNNPVGENATLELTAEGDLILRDADGLLAWSTNTAGKSVAGLNLTETGNLVLSNGNNSVVWQSFDHPTDSLVPGQILVSGKNLTGGLFSVSMTEQGLVASILSNPPRVYFKKLIGKTKQNKEASYAKFRHGSLDLYINGVEPMNPDISITVPQATSFPYMKLKPDGHLTVINWGYPLKEVADIFNISDCDYPIVCGKYGICSNGQCTCPRGASFKQISNEDPDLGCSEVVPLTCNNSAHHSFLDLDDVTYFDHMADLSDTDMNRCKEACLKNCSCKAAIFRYGSNSFAGDCYLPSEIFSLMKNNRSLTRYNSSVSVKVQIAPTVTPPAAPISPTPAKRKTSLLGPILGSTLGGLSAAAAIGTTVFVCRRRRASKEVEEDYLDQVPGMPIRFSFEELATATGNFDKKLGEGGFGSIFEGSLHDGTRIAVKCLDGVGHVKKSFLAEVQTIGSIHHINLVRLIGFCAEKSHRLLVYELMCNGSLERWIYCRGQEITLDWNNRRKIIIDIAKGLAYLHEECRQKIIHLDIKPQNILLDEHYNAKVADFGLAKLIDRNQSKIVTTMRGTPGYLAPEWLSAVITEKVDVYSFGVVILEIVCGRKVFVQSRPEEERHLPTLFMKKAEEGQWLNLVDKCCLNVESNVAQLEEMMQIAAWCIQSDHEKRPCMSMVIKILEGVVVQKDIDYNLVPHYLLNRIPEVGSKDVTHLLPSVLSGPR